MPAKSTLSKARITPAICVAPGDADRLHAMIDSALDLHRMLIFLRSSIDAAADAIPADVTDIRAARREGNRTGEGNRKSCVRSETLYKKVKNIGVGGSISRFGMRVFPQRFIR